MNNTSTEFLPVKPIVRVAWIRERIVAAEVIACTGILEWKGEKTWALDKLTHTHTKYDIQRFMPVKFHAFYVLGYETV
jgi:hypothetical protein